jgi:hypothetical protein
MLRKIIGIIVIGAVYYGPYTSAEFINDTLGFTFTRQSFINSDESSHLFVFMNGSKVAFRAQYFGAIQEVPPLQMDSTDASFEFYTKAESIYLRHIQTKEGL